jgi:hypothetical protein
MEVDELKLVLTICLPILQLINVIVKEIIKLVKNVRKLKKDLNEKENSDSS